MYHEEKWVALKNIVLGFEKLHWEREVIWDSRENSFILLMPLDSAVCRSQTREQAQNIHQTLAAAFLCWSANENYTHVILAPPLHSHLCGEVTQHLQLSSCWKDILKKCSDRSFGFKHKCNTRFWYPKWKCYPPVCLYNQILNLPSNLFLYTCVHIHIYIYIKEQSFLHLGLNMYIF